MPFIVLKESYYILKEWNHNADIKEAAIQMVERAQKRPNGWQHATWQMKVNLIYDMRHGGSGIIGLTEERKEKAVLAVLGSARHNEEFAKIIKELYKPSASSGRKQVKITDLLDGYEETRDYNMLKKKFNYIDIF